MTGDRASASVTTVTMVPSPEGLEADLDPGDLVRLEVHRGWSSLPADHPARHGLVGADFSQMIGMWWGGLMTSFRHHVGAR